MEWHFRNDDVWGVFKETVEEWDAEEGYEWGDLAVSFTGDECVMFVVFGLR